MPSVIGESETGDAVFGQGNTGRGVVGVSETAAGIEGNSNTGVGVVGVGRRGRGVVGIANDDSAGVEGNSQAGPGVFAQSIGGIALHARGGRLAGRFEGDVEVTGDLRLVDGADCAEAFDLADSCDASVGTVMVLGEDGAVRPSSTPYDQRVAGVVSGAGNFKPGIVLDARPATRPRPLIALMGKVYCKVDADAGVIRVGDLLTTSPTEGHAMRAVDPTRAYGAVIGKAMAPLKCGRGLIPVLVTLH